MIDKIMKTLFINFFTILYQKMYSALNVSENFLELDLHLSV